MKEFLLERTTLGTHEVIYEEYSSFQRNLKVKNPIIKVKLRIIINFIYKVKVGNGNFMNFPSVISQEQENNAVKIT